MDTNECGTSTDGREQKRAYTVTVRYNGEQGAMEAADRIAAACSQIQDHPQVEAVKATIPGANDFRQVRTDGGVNEAGSGQSRIRCVNSCPNGNGPHLVDIVEYRCLECGRNE